MTCPRPIDHLGEHTLVLDAVERSAAVLFDAFSRIDDTLHGGTGSTYAEEAETISKELGAFRAFLAEHRP